MTALITILISLLGYGTPADYQNYSEDQLKQEIAIAGTSTEVDGGGGSMEWP
mgnify:CR=1 FL=1